MDSVNASQLREMLIAASRAIVKSEPRLTQIDRMIGDGDHGIGMMTGFSAVEKMLVETPGFESCVDLLKQVGTELIDTIGGASGVLYGTLFISGARSVIGHNKLTASDFACFLSAGVDAIRQRGRARPGDKTMLDALIPAAEGLKHAADAGESLEACLRQAASCALDGVEATKEMRAQAGRAKAYSAASIGHPDAGAASSAILIGAWAECVEKIAREQRGEWGA